LIKSRKAESNVIAELMIVGIAIALSTTVVMVMADDDIAGDFGSLIGTLETPSEILSVSGLAQKCPGTDASVTVKNSGGVDANVRAIAINDVTNNANVNAKYPSSASSISLIKGTTSDPLTNAQCNEGTYLNIASVFSGTITDVVNNSNFTSNINGWISSSTITGGTTVVKYYLTLSATTGLGTDYRELSLTNPSSDSSTIISFGNKEDKHFLFKPGQDNSNHISSPHTGSAQGFGWRIKDPLGPTTASGTWKFGMKLKAINLDDSDGHIECEIYSLVSGQSLSQAVRLFFLHPNSVNVIDEDDDGQTLTYVFEHTPSGQIDLTNKIVLYECYLDVNENDSGSSADLILTLGADSYVEIPLVSNITVDAVVHDPTTGNPSPGSGAGSAKGVVTDPSASMGSGVGDYNFIYQFTTPAQFNSMTASYAWSYTEAGTATNTKLNFVKLIITDLSGNVITQLHCDDNSGGTCDGTAGWTTTTSFSYRTGKTSTFALSPSTNYRLVVQFQVNNQVATDTPTLTLRIDDVGLKFTQGVYEASASFTGTSSQTSPINIKLFLDSTFTQSGVSVSVQAYDYTISNYATNSPGKLDFVFATPNSDYSTTNELATASFMNNGQWQFKVTATYASTFSMNIDLIQLHAIVNKPLLNEVAYVNNVVIQPGQAVTVDATLSRALDVDSPYKVTITTERNSYSSVIKYQDDDASIDYLNDDSGSVYGDNNGIYGYYTDDDDEDDND
jgi:hypothetical protein